MKKSGAYPAAAPVVAAAAAGPLAAAVEEKTEFTVVVLAAAGDKKIEVIKGKSVPSRVWASREAKDLVEGAPKLKGRKASYKKDAEDMKKKLEAAGAKVELK